MDIRDVRRLGVTISLLGALVLAFLVLLWMQQAGHADLGLARGPLRLMSLSGWLWTGASVLLALLATMAAILYGVTGTDPRTPSRRQVQCQDCKAVFWIPDNGVRPLEHTCPSCNALGVYDGRQPPVGKPPVVRPEKIVELPLTCRACNTRFTVRDTGVRPLRVTCVKCQAIGTVL